MRHRELTVDGQVIGVDSRGATLLQLGRGAHVDIDGIAAEETVHVALILAGHDDRIDVLAHEELDLGVCECARQAGGSQEKSW